MNHQDSRQSGRRSGRGSRRPSSRPRSQAPSAPAQPVKLSLWQRLAAFFGGGAKTSATQGKSAPADHSRQERRGNDRPGRPVEQVEVTSPKLYVGNLSFNATESDLFELFKGVGSVRNAEIVTNKYNDKSKGFGFVTMASLEEAKRAVLELHDKEFLNRKLLVSGAKSGERETDYRG